ncbi:fructosamine kinase family protein [Kribbella sp. CA-293567]|uniref:fructosamine kinase family protein n=1 Tax=Kribbella sp. CA-293567 TaxID=3002436 RepID=UPI0022DE7F18|nr:fructosamine kinase family protein [Kribbella sp. CA-293567]WBQ04744.1 fructosamine kinase family protein [Kribbella sp. CA-293567]
MTAEQLTGGFANQTWRVRLTGRTVIVKFAEDDQPGVFATEAAGLAVLRAEGLRTPDVIGVTDHSLTLQALEPAPPGSNQFWEAAGRAVAALHTKTSPRHGWPADGWLGRLPQENAWDTNGRRFFATNRVLRYLREPKAQEVLTASDRTGIEKLCARFPQLLPEAPAVLTHGDLWRSNVIATADGLPVFIDPAVSWTWAEVDLSMMFCSGGVPERFFAAYHELRPPEPGWQQRMRLLNLRELLSMVAHFGAIGDCLAQIRGVVAAYR